MTHPSTMGRSAVTAARNTHLTVHYRSPTELSPHPRNSRKHSRKQLRQIADSIRRFGFTVPVLIDSQGKIIAGHGRVEAAKLIGLTEVPTICLDNLSEAELRAFMIADNRLTENAEWNESLLAQELKELSELNLDFSLEITGFEMGEIDVLIEGLTDKITGPDPGDQLPDLDNAIPVTRPGDLWLLGKHRVLCADARHSQPFEQLMNGAVAAMGFSDPPYNVRVQGHASGKGAVKHSDFIMGSGELDEDEFIAFLVQALDRQVRHSVDGALVFVCMDWRHIGEVLAAGKQVFSELKNVCVWVKDRAGMGSLYRSQHELVFLFKMGMLRIQTTLN